MSPAQVSVNLEGASHIALQKQLPGPTTGWTYCWWWCHTNSGSAARAKDPKQKLFVLLQLRSMGSTTQGHPPLSFLPIHTSTVQPVSERGAVDMWIKAANSMGRKRKTSRESWKLKCDPPGHPSGSYYYLSEWQSRNRGWNCWTLAVGAKKLNPKGG